MTETNENTGATDGVPVMVEAGIETNDGFLETIAPEAEASGPSDSTSIEEEVEEQSKRAFYMRLTIGFIFAVFVIFVIVDSATNMHALGALHNFLEWVEENPVGGVFAFVVGKKCNPADRGLKYLLAN